MKSRAAPLETVPPANAPEFSVSELASALKRTVEDRFGYVRVRGEISNYRGPHSSGHVYFCLKDENARLDAVIWRTTFARLKQRPEEGLEVIASGKITTFPGKSSYQIVVDALEPAGKGALMALLDERRQRLAAEGLFDEARKRPPPFLPAVIGVVTSPTGAVIRDILHRLQDRFPRHVLVWPVRVQGETCAAEVAAAIEGFNALPPDGALPRPDVIIVARGGGSLEDLWGFNEEITVRAAASSAIPLIAAIGHETDVTLIDFAADLRAPTPTAAAEKCVPVRRELIERTAALSSRLSGAERRLLDAHDARLRALSRVLPAPDQLLAQPRQRADRAGERLSASARATLHARRLRLVSAAHVLARHSPQAELARANERAKALGARLARALATRIEIARHRAQASRQRLAHAEKRLQGAMANLAATRRTRVTQLAQLLSSLSHKNVLARGFALARDERNALLRSARDLAPGMRFSLEFLDGRVAARAEGEMSSAAPARARKKSKDDGQSSLF